MLVDLIYKPSFNPWFDTHTVVICLLFYKIQLSRHDTIDEIVAFDIWAEPTVVGIPGMSNIFSAAICAIESKTMQTAALEC